MDQSSSQPVDTSFPERAEAFAVLLHAARLGRTDIIKNAVQLLQQSGGTGGPDAASSGGRGSLAGPLPDLLVSARAEPGGSCLLHIGAAAGHADVVRALLHMGMPCNIVPDVGEHAGRSPYMCAAGDAVNAFHVYFFEQIALGNYSTVMELLNSGVSAALRDGFASDDSALHWAVSFGKKDVAQLLLDHNCDVNSVNAEKQTPLHLACKNGGESMIQLLLERGARVDVRDLAGRIPSDVLSASSPVAASSLRSLLPPEFDRAAGSDRKLNGSYVDDGSSGVELNAAAPPCSETRIEEEATAPPESPTRSPFIWPEPQICEFISGSFQVGLVPDPLVISIDVDASLRVAAERALELSGLHSCLSAFGISISVLTNAKSAKIHLCIDNLLCSGAQRYVISITSSGINLLSSDLRGLHYGLSTLLQIIKFYGSTGDAEVSSRSNDQEEVPEAMSPSGADFHSYGVSGATVVIPDRNDVPRQRTVLTVPRLFIEDWPDVLDRTVKMPISWDSLVNIDYITANVAFLSRCRVSRILLSFETMTSQFLGSDPAESNDKKLFAMGAYLRHVDLICRDYEIELYPIMCVNLGDPMEKSDRLTVVSLSSYFSTRAVAVAFFLTAAALEESGRDDSPVFGERVEAVLSSVAAAGLSRAFIYCPAALKSIVHRTANACCLRFVVAPSDDEAAAGPSLLSRYRVDLSNRYFGREAEVALIGNRSSSVYVSFSSIPSFIDKICLLAVSTMRWNTKGANTLWGSSSDDDDLIKLKAIQYIFAPSINFETDDRVKSEPGSSSSAAAAANEPIRRSGFMFWRSAASTDSTTPNSSSSASSSSSADWSAAGASASKMKTLLQFAIGIHPDAKEIINSATLSKFWKCLLARSAKDFVSCLCTAKLTRRGGASIGGGEGDGFIPTRDETAAVLRTYRRVLAALDWKLDRRKMAQIREENASMGTTHAHNRGNAGLVYESESLFNEFCTESSVKSLRHELRYEISQQSLDLEELCISLHLVCTICRVFMAGYNAAANNPSYKALSQPLTFSQLSSLLPTGSTSDAANALLEGIEYTVSVWKRKHLRLSLRSAAYGSLDAPLLLPGLGAFQWVLAHGHQRAAPSASSSSSQQRSALASAEVGGNHGDDDDDKAQGLVARTLFTLLHGKL